ncbi:hypothetical protein [Alkalihalobacillus sp. 1P02AB]|uniref:hypothetical protein n=1 Tax=Alkalihalobacillus sp. 1P02AB TaxID=3132260 RepID=UPI0039A5734F
MEQQGTSLKPLSQLLIKPTTAKEWGICIVGWLICLAVLYVAVFYEVVYRAVVLLFLIAFAFIVLQKLHSLQKELFLLKSGQSVELQKPKEYKPQIKVDELEAPTMIFEAGVEEKEKELEKIDLDQTLLMEDLLKKADLNEREKQQYRTRFKEKEVEKANILTELTNAKNKIQQAFIETKNIFVKEDPMKELAAALDSENFEGSSIQELNEQLSMIKPNLSQDLKAFMESSSFVDEQFKLTRLGYKTLIKYSSKK